MAITMKYDKPTALRIRDFLLKQGLTVEGTYGLMANLYTESRFRSNNAQNSYMTKMGITDEIYTARVDSGEYKDFVIDKVGYGLAQWTSSGRKQALYNYSKSNNVSISNETMQLNFLMKELSTSYKSTLNVLKTSHSIRDCAKYVMTKFERPADQSENAQNKRADYGEQLFSDLEGSIEQKYYRVQVGAFKSETNAKNLQAKLKTAGFNVIIKQIDGLYKCQVGAFNNKSNAENLLQSVKSKGFDAFLIFQ